jgi:flagellar motor switch protein FliN
MTTYMACWATVAANLFSQALAGESSLSECAMRRLGTTCFGFSAPVSGDEQGRFSVILDESILESPLMGDGVDQKAGWSELLREIADAAAGELLSSTGKRCRVGVFEPVNTEGHASRAFELRSGERTWTVLVQDDVHPGQLTPDPDAAFPSSASPPLNPGIELLLDVELEASLRFGSREMPLGQILDLGPGDVVQLDRHVSDPVDLLVGDKIVARGEVVLVNGNFGLRVTEVAEPRKRLESIRCLF